MTKYRTPAAGVEAAARMGRALANPIRLRALLALRGHELCLCQLEELFELAASTMSKHMSVLADSGLVQSRREGRWTHYRLPDQPGADVESALGLVFGMASQDPIAAGDAARVATTSCRQAPAGGKKRGGRG